MLYFWGEILPDFGPKCEKVRKFKKDYFFLRMINFGNTVSHMHPQMRTGIRTSTHWRARTRAHTHARTHENEIACNGYEQVITTYFMKICLMQNEAPFSGPKRM